MRRLLLPLLFALLLLLPRPAAAELRGAWIATVENIDWPSAPGLSAQQQQKELIDIFDSLKKLGFNAVFLQVRPEGDAFWPSAYEPWSRYLSGEQGAAPGYDPLAFAVKEAHGRGLRLHAWVNPFRVLQNNKSPLAKNSPARRNKDWVIQYNGKSFYDPGNPHARAHVIKVITEIAGKYEVDGIHMDDYFYPYPDAKNTPVNDGASFKKHAKKGQTLEQWRAENINAFIKDLRASVKKAKPDMAFGISPFGIWCNAKDCDGGSATAGFNSYLKQYADSRSWVQDGLVDYIAPQLYWPIGHKLAPYDKLLDWWAAQTAGAPGSPKLYIGIAAYRHTAGDWKNPVEIPAQIRYGRKKGVDGFIYFSAGKVLSDKRSTANTIAALHK